MIKVYIVEDDADIRELVIYALKSKDYEVKGFETGTAFFAETETIAPNLVLLDIMLPGDDGLTILKTLKNNMKFKNLPVIMLTAKGSEFDKVIGLDMGADDYLTKPFGVTELISRINAVLRRSGTTDNTTDKLEYKNISIDNARRIVFSDGENIALTYKEYELLYYLLLNKGIVLSRDKITETVWGFGFEGESRTVDMHIKTLRQKLGASGLNIKTIRNVGYKLGE